MKLRIIAVSAAAIAGGLVLLASPADAKGVAKVKISGPGLEDPIVIKGGGGPGLPTLPNQMAETTALFRALHGERLFPTCGRCRPEKMGKPDGDLGPEYIARYWYLTGPHQQKLLRQKLYPYADDGFVAHTTGGQVLFQWTTKNTWAEAGDWLGRTLERKGLPEAAPSP